MKKDYLLKNPEKTENKYKSESEYLPQTNSENFKNQFFNFSPIYQPEQTAATGAAIGTSSEYPVSASISGMNTEYGNMYGANVQANLMRLIDSLPPEERKKYLAQVGINYNYAQDYKQSTYSPMFMLGYNNQSPNGGFGVSVQMDNRKIPTYAAEYRQRF